MVGDDIRNLEQSLAGYLVSLGLAETTARKHLTRAAKDQRLMEERRYVRLEESLACYRSELKRNAMDGRVIV